MQRANLQHQLLKELGFPSRPFIGKSSGAPESGTAAGAGKCPKVGRLGICNFCGKRAYCRLEKRFYDYEDANRESRKKRSETRSGTRIPSECLAELDSLSQQIKDTGSIHHVFVANGWAGEICCERTLRRLVYSGALSVKPHELRRYVRFKRELPKSQKAKRIIIRDVRALIGRTYGDFLAYTAAHKRAMITQYDSVVGKRDDRTAILTITFPRFNLQIGRLIAKGDPSSAKRAIVAVMSRLIAAGFPDAFEACLCDNGTEFATFYEIEGYAKSAGAAKMPRLLRETLSLQLQSRMREEPRIRALRVPQGEIARRADPGKRGLRV